MLSPSCLQVADFKTARSQGGSCTDSPFGWKWTYTLVRKQRNDQAEIHKHLVEKIKFIWHFWIIQIRNLFQMYCVPCSHVPWEKKVFSHLDFTLLSLCTTSALSTFAMYTVQCSLQCTCVYLCRGSPFSCVWRLRCNHLTGGTVRDKWCSVMRVLRMVFFCARSDILRK